MVLAGLESGSSTCSVKEICITDWNSTNLCKTYKSSTMNEMRGCVLWSVESEKLYIGFLK
jgi:hypothetical protein